MSKSYVEELMIAWLITCISPLGSSMVRPALTQTMQEFHETDQVIGTFSVTIWLLGFAIGPLFLGFVRIAPVSSYCR
jgi:MFS family permease